MKKVFFSQRLLDSMIGEGKIKLENNILILLTKNNQSFELEPAVRIIRTSDGKPDPHGLVGQIKSEKDLKAANAEIYLNSVIYGDAAYQAEPGFIGEEKEVMDKLSDTDLLARFLLESLL